MARRRRGRPRRKEVTIQSEETSIALGVFFLIISGLILLSIFVNDGLFLQEIHKFFGSSSVLAFIFLLFLSMRMFGVVNPLTQTKSLVGQFLLVIIISGFLQLTVDVKDAYSIAERGEMGGLLGYNVTNKLLVEIFAKEGALLILVLGFLAAAPLAFSLSIRTSFQAIGKFFNGTYTLFQTVASKFSRNKDQNADPLDETDSDRMISDFHQEEEDALSQENVEDNQVQTQPVQPVHTPLATMGEENIDGAIVIDELQFKEWKLPPVDLLNPYKLEKPEQANIKRSAGIIEQTLESFGVRAKVIDVKSGPTVTQYALNIALGTKVAKIANLKNDLALALAAPTSGVRIETPIPGTSYVGVEIPNKRRLSVQIREVIESDSYTDKKKLLPIVVGKNINGDPIVGDLKEMPHLLIAGSTGSGKSVVTNGFLISLLMCQTPDQLRLILVDPKQVELYDYNGIPHLLTPVITDMDKVLNSLKWAVMEMERRYTILRQAHVRNIEGYNKAMGFAAMPFIVIVIDEMADLMLSVGAEVETAIVRLAQKSRAVGIHLVLATQRPSVDIITGLIKANIPGRIGMSVTTQVDSRVILDQGGAESLLGKGDMLYKEPDKNKPSRLQAAWVSPEEIHRVVDFIKDQVKEEEVIYTEEIVEKQVVAGDPASESAQFSDDDLFSQAARIVVQAKKGSASLLQRKLSIGYNRAARLLDELQAHGIVGPQDGSKPRQVLISDVDSFLAGGAQTDSGE